MSAPSGPPALDELMKGGTEVRRFALSLYGREGVSAACLTLQEEAGVDVNVLLFAAFMGAGRGLPLDAARAAEARASLAGWHQEIVKALRTVRRRLKTGPSPAPDTRTERLRGKIQAIEIEAELIELDTLDALGATLPDAADQPDAAAAQGLARDSMVAVVTDAAGRAPTAGEEDAITLIAQQAAQVGRGPQT